MSLAILALCSFFTNHKVIICSRNKLFDGWQIATTKLRTNKVKVDSQCDTFACNVFVCLIVNSHSVKSPRWTKRSYRSLGLEFNSSSTIKDEYTRTLSNPFTLRYHPHNIRVWLDAATRGAYPGDNVSRAHLFGIIEISNITTKNDHRLTMKIYPLADK